VRDTTSGLFLFFLRVAKRNVTPETSLPQTKDRLLLLRVTIAKLQDRLAENAERAEHRTKILI
jgi:hypothetical protein